MAEALIVVVLAALFVTFCTKRGLHWLFRISLALGATLFVVVVFFLLVVIIDKATKGT